MDRFEWTDSNGPIPRSIRTEERCTRVRHELCLQCHRAEMCRGRGEESYEEDPTVFGSLHLGSSAICFASGWLTNRGNLQTALCFARKQGGNLSLFDP